MLAVGVFIMASTSYKWHGHLTRDEEHIPVPTPVGAYDDKDEGM